MGLAQQPNSPPSSSTLLQHGYSAPHHYSKRSFVCRRLPAARNPGLWIRPTSYTRPWALPVSGFPSGAKIQLACISTDNDIWEYLGPRFALHSSRGRR